MYVARMRPGILVLALGALALAPAVLGGPSGIHREPGPDQGELDFTIHFMFPPTPEAIAELKAVLVETNDVLCDATEGQIRLGTVTLTAGDSVAKMEADTWYFLEDAGRPTAQMCDPPDDPQNASDAEKRCIGLEAEGHRMRLYRPDMRGLMVAHELGHFALDLHDEYPENPRLNNCWGVDRCVECGDIDTRNNCMMSTDLGCPGPQFDCPADPDDLCVLYSSELCIDAGHDTLGGDPAYFDSQNRLCTDDAAITCQPGRPCPPAGLSGCDEGCCFFNPDASVCEYTGALQSRWSVEKGENVLRSCWGHLEWIFPEFVTPPGGLPVADTPLDCAAAFDPDTDVVDNTAFFDRIVLVLDVSFSMLLHPDELCFGGCTEVCNNGLDDDLDDTFDENPCDASRLERLQGAANAFASLLDGSGAEAGIVSYADCPEIELELTPVDGNKSTFFAIINDLEAGGVTGIGDALQEAQIMLEEAGPAQNRAILLITDGHQNCGPGDAWCCNPITPLNKLPDLEVADITLFPLIIGDPGNDDVLAGMAASTGGATYRATSTRQVIPAFVNQFASYTGTGVLFPSLVYRLNRLGTIEPPQNSRDSTSWLDGQDTPVGDPGAGDPIYANNVFEIPVEAGVERLILTLGGDMDNLDGFGLRVVLDGPAGLAPNHFDTDVPGPDPFLRVTREDHFMLLVLEDPNPGTWQVEVTVPDQSGVDVIQTGHLTVLVDNPRVVLDAAIHRQAVTAPNQAVKLVVHPSYDMPIWGVGEMDARVRRPDGTWQDLILNESELNPGQYTVWISDLPAQGLYEVRVRMRTGPSALIDPGETLFGGPAAPTPAPDVVRTEVLHFVNPTVGDKVCPDPLDCDGDGVTGESGVTDFDGDGRPDDCDADAEDDEVLDTVEGIGQPDTDGDGTPDFLDYDSDDDGAFDPYDPASGAFNNALTLRQTEVGTCGQTVTAYTLLSTDENVSAMTVGLEWNPADHLELVSIEPGPDVEASSIQSFSAEIESANLFPGQALTELTLVAGQPVGPGTNLRVLKLVYRAKPSAQPGSSASICFADRIGIPSRDTELTVERAVGPVTVSPRQTCGAVDFLGDVDPPVLQCPGDETVEADAQCNATWTATATVLDDCDPSPAITSSPPLPVTYDSRGVKLVTFTATDSAGNGAACPTWITVDDVLPPVGSITAPADGLCTAQDVTIQDDFADACDGGALARTYTPTGGPTYRDHGDYLVTLGVTDGSGNSALDVVPFTIDKTAPFVDVLDGLTQLDLPSDRPFTTVFDAADDDGATGGVVLENVLLDACTAYDGSSYGDADGTLLDETMTFDFPTACEAVARCGLPGLDQMQLRAEATDCGGGIGFDEMQVNVVPPLTQPDCQVNVSVAKVAGEAEVSWVPVFDAQSYDVIRGDVGRLALTGGEVDLGTVVCLAEDTAATSVTDADLPPPGEAFFYVARFKHFATTSEYGWSSSGLPERPSAGDCTP